MRACVAVLFTLMFINATRADGTYTGDRLPEPDAHASFVDLIDGAPIAYEEAGLRFDVPGAVAFKSSRNGFEGTDNLYPGGGAFARLTIRRADGLPIEVLQFQVSDGFQTAQVFVWATAVVDGEATATFDLDLTAGDTIGFVGPFDEIRVGAYQSPSARDAHNETAVNALAVDNVCIGAMPACLCEVTGDACVDLIDLLTFLTDWFPRSTEADANADGQTDVEDLLAFLGCWYDALPGLCRIGTQPPQ